MRYVFLLSLIALLVSGCNTAAKSPKIPHGIVKGIVTIGPTCPVVREGENCADRPLAGTTVAATWKGGTAATHTSSSGHFRISVAAGLPVTIIVHHRPSDSQSSLVQVKSGQVEKLSLIVDSGIR